MRDWNRELRWRAGVRRWFISCFACESGKIAGLRPRARRQPSHRQPTTPRRCTTYLVRWRVAAMLACMFWRRAGTREAGLWQGSSHPLRHAWHVCVHVHALNSSHLMDSSLDRRRVPSAFLRLTSHSCCCTRQALIPHDGPRCEQGPRPTQNNVAVGSSSASSSTPGGVRTAPGIMWCAKGGTDQAGAPSEWSDPPVAPGNDGQHTLCRHLPNFPP